MPLIEVRVRLAEVSVCAGFSWLTMGKLLRGGGKFCAVCSLFVREMFRDCGISTLLKLSEIDLALSRQCSFIQTWHEANNPNRFPGRFHPDDLYPPYIPLSSPQAPNVLRGIEFSYPDRWQARIWNVETAGPLPSCLNVE
jgi:hypothetical protein